MPAEVRLALRGPDHRLPYDPEPPTVAWLPLSRAVADARAAVLAFDAAATAVLDDVDRRPLVPLQVGGIGTRELRRLTRTTRLQEATVRIVLELARHAGLLTRTWGPIRTSDAYPDWRHAEPAERHARLVRAWWEFPGRPSQSLDRYGGVGRPLTSTVCDGCRLQHTSLLAHLRAEQGISLDDAALLASWHVPGAHVTDPPYRAAWTEATTLGVIAQGALSELGVALRDGDGDLEALRAACAAMVPASTPTATFGSDLTALAVGSPTARVSRVLDSCADRESTGGAVTWRLSRDSVRRALDEGWAVADLRAALAEVAGDGPLPSAVTVLLDDVDRAYGRAVVHTAQAVVVAADEVTAAELRHDRRLAALGLVAVTPTVFASVLDPAKTMAALRKAGHLPRQERLSRAGDASKPGPPLVVGRPGLPPAAPPPARRRPAEVPSADVHDLARALLEAPRFPSPPFGSPWEAEPGWGAVDPWSVPNPWFTDDPVRPPAAAPAAPAAPDAPDGRPPGLSPLALRTLHRALDSGGRVEIVYRDAQGAITERVIRPRDLSGDLSGGVLDAWCELRGDGREFVLGRILAVRAV